VEYRFLGRSGLKVSELSLGTATFGGGSEFFRAWGQVGVDVGKRMLDMCLEAGVNLIDVSNNYSGGLAEEVLGKVLKESRNRVYISTKAFFPMGQGPNDQGASRSHLIEQCEGSLRRLGTDHIDVYHIHGFDAITPVEETLDTLNTLVRTGKVRYIACSNFSGWHLMKSLAASDRFGWARYVAHQVYYSLIGREYEWELMPLGADQGVGALIWSPLGWGRLTGRIRRGKQLPEISRLHKTAEAGPPVETEYLYRVVDALEELARETGRTVAQVSLNWLLQRPTVASVIVGARNEDQLKENLGAAGWELAPAQIAKLDNASDQTLVYPYWHQRAAAGWGVDRNPPLLTLKAN
jgi:aryl-alcohol dehydrogenase-like predicted oxidoreductase